MKKRFLSLFLAVTMTVASCMPAVGAETSAGESITSSAEAAVGAETSDGESAASSAEAAAGAETSAGESTASSAEAAAEQEAAVEAASGESTASSAEAAAGAETSDGESAASSAEAAAEQEAAVDEAPAWESTADETEADESAGSGEKSEETQVDKAGVDETALDGISAEDEDTISTDEAVLDDTALEETETNSARAADSEEVQIPDIVPEAVSYKPGEDVSADELFAAYVDDEFGISNDLVEQQNSRRVTAGSKLSGTDSGLYNYIDGQLPLIASGERTSTIFEVPVEELGFEQLFWTAEELGVDVIVEDSKITAEAKSALMELTRFHLSTLIDALLADYPYLLYWYDKTASTTGTYFTITAKKVDGEYRLGIKGCVTLRFPVAGAYASEDYVVDSSIGESVRAAVANAADIVSKYSGEQDYDILAGYKEEICSLTSYNRDAINNNEAYGNPWQLVWVFDGDDSTKVVCEGYSKAFKYLCDQTEFAAEIGCIQVTGDMNGTGHMWNIVNMDDEQNYLVDVTNCDSGSTSTNRLFLMGSDGSPESGYTISSITYVYDEDMLELWDTEDLTLMVHGYGAHTWATEYTVDQKPTYTEKGVKSIHCTVCDAIQEGSEVPVDLLTVSGIEDKTYTGSALTQEIAVKDGDVTLTEGTDYTVSYADNLNAGTAKVILTNTGDYTGTYEQEFEIAAKAVTPTVELSQTVFTYNGEEQKPTVVVKDGETELTESDYEITWPDSCVDAGTYTVTVTLNGNYTGTAEQEFKIMEKVPSVQLSQTTLSYSGEDQKPSVVVMDGETELTESDYTVTWPDSCVDIGTYTVTVVLKGNYSGIFRLKFEIVAKEITPTVELSQAVFTYNGEEQKPSVVVKDGETVLSESDYEIAWPDGCVDVGTYIVTVTLKGNYSGTNDQEFSISAKAVTPTVELSQTVFTYNGEEQKPSVVVKDGETVFAESDYEITWPDNCVDAGRYIVTVTLKGNYSGTNNQEFSISAKVVTPTVELSQAAFTYNGEEQKPSVVVKDGETVLSESDYEITWPDGCVDMGTYIVTVTLKGNYSGTNDQEFNISAKAVTPTVELSQAAFTYNGKEQKPSVVVKDGEIELTTSDYEIGSWSGTCINAGTYTVTVTLKGNYSGSANVSYAINNAENTITANNLYKVYSSKKKTYALGAKAAYGKLTYKSSSKSVTVSKAGKVTIKAKFQGKACITITSVGNANYISKTKKIYVIVRPTMTRIATLKNTATKKITVTWKRNKVGTGTQIQYSTSKTFKNAKSVWATKNTIVSKTFGKLIKGKKYYVRIRTYRKVGKYKYYSTWSAVKTVKVKK